MKGGCREAGCYPFMAGDVRILRRGQRDNGWRPDGCGERKPVLCFVNCSLGVSLGNAEVKEQN
jgi:hypothetical protein